MDDVQTRASRQRHHMKRLVLVGAGHAHAQVLHELSCRPLDDIKVCLVSPHTLAPYSGMVPGWLAGHYAWAECCIDFTRLCRRAGAELIIDSVAAIDTVGSQLMLESGRTLGYRWLSLNHGSTLSPTGHARIPLLPMRPLADLQDRWNGMLDIVRHLPPNARFHILMIGGGTAGVESLLAVRHRLTGIAPHVHFSFALATHGNALMPGQARAAARLLQARMENQGIRIHFSFPAEKLMGDMVIATSGQAIRADAVLWATGAQSLPLARKSGLAVDERGFIRIDRTLRSVSHPDILAAGDCASWQPPLPKAGVFAVRMGPVLAGNLRALVAGKPLDSFTPQRRHLALIGTGDRHAVGSWGRFGWQGHWAWRWKQYIDRRFIARYNGLARDDKLHHLTDD